MHTEKTRANSHARASSSWNAIFWTCAFGNGSPSLCRKKLARDLPSRGNTRQVDPSLRLKWSKRETQFLVNEDDESGSPVSIRIKWCCQICLPFPLGVVLHYSKKYGDFIFTQLCHPSSVMTHLHRIQILAHWRASTIHGGEGTEYDDALDRILK